ncbi:MAG: PorV/PorQ family protein, partial [candidate division Zixibacteria bacterium]|nr:PorV/PorQ family protein [candidate division Zixibacteria bacterium]
MKRLCSFVLAMIIILSGPLSYAGSGVKLLSVEIGARPSGMGGAFTAVSNDPYSGAYNPASPCGIGPLAASVGYNSYWENIRLENVYASFEKKSITYSAGVNFAVVDDIQGRGNTATSTYYPFDAHDISFKTGLSMKLDKNIAVGFMAGWIFEKIESYRGSAFNIDIGLLAQLTSKLNIGLAGMNLGPKMQIREEKYQLPYAFRAGAVYKLTKFLPVLDFVIQDDDFHAHLG